MGPTSRTCIVAQPHVVRRRLRWRVRDGSITLDQAVETVKGPGSGGGSTDILLPCELRAFICDAPLPATYTSYIVPIAKTRACAILAEFNKAQTDLLGKAVIQACVLPHRGVPGGSPGVGLGE